MVNMHDYGNAGGFPAAAGGWRESEREGETRGGVKRSAEGQIQSDPRAHTAARFRAEVAQKIEKKKIKTD